MLTYAITNLGAFAIVNGALWYGFSSITVPLALLFLANRVLNPALVLVEVGLNAYVLWVNREALPSVAKRVGPIVMGLVPGVVVGTLVVAQVRPDWLKTPPFYEAQGETRHREGKYRSVLRYREHFLPVERALAALADG